MKNLLFLAISFSVLFASCDSEPDYSQYESSISGYIDNIPGKEIVLTKQTPEGIIPMDTTWIEEDGSFLFTPDFGDIAVYRVLVDFNKYLTIAAQKGDHIILEADGLDLYNNYYVGGSEESELIKIVVDETMALGHQLDSISEAINHQKAAKNSQALYKSFEVQNQLYSNHRNFSLDFIEKYPGSIAAYFVVIGLQLEEDPNAYRSVAKNLEQSHPTFSFLPKLQEQVNILSLANVGTLAEDLAYPDPEGNIISLSSLRGKYVLVDFWASWCKPCRFENPQVLELYKKYKDKGFEIYGYSLDKDKEAWVNAIAEDQINWVHTSDLKLWQAEGAKKYGVQSIPATFLIDPEGYIIARDFRSAELGQKLQEIFGE
ncbi:TlpA family protein disulfide reductase [bacterium SCSIO 12643]|nr:TlpA family protein disulfide reductase [bacterium SCSIO 12643]